MLPPATEVAGFRIVNSMKLLSLVATMLFVGSNLFAAKVGLLIVATGKYDCFVDPLIESARRYFCQNHEVTYYVFTDGVISEAEDVVKIYQKRLGWPYDTLMRNSIYHEHRDSFASEDYLFATDADMLFVDTVGDEIFGDRVATMHPGYATTGGSFPFETNKKSGAYMSRGSAKNYFAGGFFGGSQQGFRHIIEETTNRVLEDLSHGIVAVWHDESQWNRYCLDYKPSIVLTPSYCYASLAEMGYSKEMSDSFDQKFPRKLLALTKNHKEYRGQ